MVTFRACDDLAVTPLIDLWSSIQRAPTRPRVALSLAFYAAKLFTALKQLETGEVVDAQSPQAALNNATALRGQSK